MGIFIFQCRLLDGWGFSLVLLLLLVLAKSAYVSENNLMPGLFKFVVHLKNFNLVPNNGDF